MTRPRSVAAIVLAAGGSRRLGHPKQLVEIDGVPLVRRAVDRVREAGARWIVVVTGAAADEVAAACTSGSSGAGSDASPTDDVHFTHNPDWASGQGGSLACGALALHDLGTDAEAVLVALCDQPHLPVAHFEHLIEAARIDPPTIAATGYADGGVGAPACFPRPCWPELAACEGDTGAKHLIASGRHAVTAITLDESSTRDVDTPGDVDDLRRSR